MQKVKGHEVSVSRRGAMVPAIVGLLLIGAAMSLIIWSMSSGDDSDRSRLGGESSAAKKIPARGRTIGWPDAANTGFRHGIKLTVRRGNVKVSQQGTTIERAEIHGTVTITASNVVIKDSRVLGQIVVPMSASRVHGVTIMDTELDGQRKGDPDLAQGGIVTYGGLSCLRCNIHGFNQGIAIDSSNPVMIQDSWVHDIWPNSDGHKDAIITNGSTNVTIDHNRLSCEVEGCSAAIGLFGDFSPIANWRVNNNLLNGGSYCSYSGSSAAKRYPVASNIKWTNNQYGRELHGECGQYGPVAAWSQRGGNVWSGNVWADTKTTIPAP